MPLWTFWTLVYRSFTHAVQLIEAVCSFSFDTHVHVIVFEPP